MDEEVLPFDGADEELEAEIRKWESLDPEEQKKRLKPIEDSFGVGGP